MLTEFWPLQKYGEQYEVIKLDRSAKVATLASGARIQYNALLSTMPLDLTLHKLGEAKWANELSYRLALNQYLQCSPFKDLSQCVLAWS